MCLRKKLRCISILVFSLIFFSAKPDGFSISEVSDAVMARMEGKSYPKGCSIKRSELRYLQVLHYDENGKVQKGELVCNKAIAQDLLDIFRALYDAKYPIGKMTLIDGYDGVDERSMADNNTSCFNYRRVKGTKTLSKHSLGMAIDVNPLYNPCVRTRDGKQTVEPANGKAWATNRTASRSKMLITKGDLCYRLFIQHGFRWGGAWRSVKDYQHFEK